MPASATSSAKHARDTETSDARRRIASEEPVLVADGVSKRYRRTGRRSWFARWRGADPVPTVTAVDDVSLSVHRGEIVGLAGPSGSGKSTLLHLLAGLETPTTGTVTFEGTAIDALSARARTRHRLTNVGFVFQRFHLLPALTAQANVALPLIELGVGAGERSKRANDLLEQVGLGGRLDHTPGELSGGEQQRVAIARALVADPPVVLADEPTGELDTETGASVLEILERFVEDRVLVVASHDRATLEIADRVVHLTDGAIVEDGTTA